MEQPVARQVLIAGVFFVAFSLASTRGGADRRPGSGGFPGHQWRVTGERCGGVLDYRWRPRSTANRRSTREGYRLGRKTFVDARLGVRVWRRLAVGAGVSVSDAGSSATASGSVPNPLFFNRPRNASPLTVNLKHRQLSVDLQAFYFVPITDAFHVALFAGPSMLQTSRASVDGITRGPETDSPLFGTIALDDVTTTLKKTTTVGASVGIDMTVMLTGIVGAGVFAKYVAGSIDVGAQSVDLSGLQAGAGLRFRF